jgi:hypothetical protein
MYDDQILIQQGWQCPICKRVYSPTTPMCLYCGGDQKASASTNGTITADTAENSYKTHFCTLKGTLCINASLNGFCTLSACNRLEYSASSTTYN